MLERVADVSPRDASIANHLAETLGLIGRYEEADRWSRRAMELGPDQPMNFTFAAWCAVQAGWPERARTYVAAMPPFDDLEIRHHLFRIHLALRDYAAALRHAEALPECAESQYVTVCRDLAMATAYRAMDRPEQAREHFVRAEALLAAQVAAKPDAGNLVAAHAVALAGAGRGDEALAAIERSFALFPASKDRWIATWRQYDRVVIELLLARPDAAVATLADLMQRQTDIVSPAILAGSPVFDALRGREDFRALIARHS
jgi:tetratricopeptide (TPR) repeat protein